MSSDNYSFVLLNTECCLSYEISSRARISKSVALNVVILDFIIHKYNGPDRLHLKLPGEVDFLSFTAQLAMIRKSINANTRLKFVTLHIINMYKLNYESNNKVDRCANEPSNEIHRANFRAARPEQLLENPTHVINTGLFAFLDIMGRFYILCGIFE